MPLQVVARSSSVLRRWLDRHVISSDISNLILFFFLEVSWCRPQVDIPKDHICEEYDRGVLLCAMWLLWCSRNDCRHGKTPIATKAVVDWAMDCCFNLMSAGKTKVQERGSTNVHQWLRPPTGFLKIDTDGAFTAETFSGATGVVVRRTDGSFVRGMARQLISVASALVAEAEACRDGVRLLQYGVCEGVILETDSQELVTLWKDRSNHRSEIATILREIQKVVAFFTSFSMVHAKRSANVAARIFAKHASSSSRDVWIENPLASCCDLFKRIVIWILNE
ncbi:hypothetical protein C2845_PM11G15090 [Panicum miliaceum]|uniref:RNase H type-1 domain-containing protein n=1 Tax=Panicum miliaceum TaxID=4540 RepID=A0A3L6RY55_PANMI|nr:hypothetical protein C2845_PM11G15090 [Panicum miliaceum]